MPRLRGSGAGPRSVAKYGATGSVTSFRWPAANAAPTSADITLFDADLMFAGVVARAPLK